MLPDYKNSLFAPLKFRHVHFIVLQATFSSGVATVDASESSPGVTLVKDTTGDYDVTFPKGQWVHVVGCALDPASDTPTDSVETKVSPRSFVATGTGKLLFSHVDDGGEADPEDNTRVYLTLMLGRA